MSATLDNFSDSPTDTCPHGVDTSETVERCWYCYAKEQSGSMAIDDPRREQ